jgi:hypothetical protein
MLSRIVARNIAAERQKAVGPCERCVEFEAENLRLQREIDSLKCELVKHQKTIEDLRGCRKSRSKNNSEAHKPSSKEEHKANSSNENQQKQGGAQKGHQGSSREEASPDKADEIINLEPPKCCPCCGGELRTSLSYFRRIIDIPNKIAKELCFQVPHSECIQCGEKVRFQVGALPRMLIGNRAAAGAAVMHFLKGISISQVISSLHLPINDGTLHGVFEVIARHLDCCFDSLFDDYRTDEVRHADETSWRTDGKSGYGWLFSSFRTSIFIFGVSRAAVTPKEVFGAKKLGGSLVVDRYAGYNQLPVSIQYCYAHIKRELDEIIKSIEYPDSKPIGDELSKLFSKAMKLKESSINDEDYYREATMISDRMMELSFVNQPDNGIRKMQCIILDHADRMFLWVKNRNIPCHNNYAEREIRPIVLARKRCFGSQSQRGAWRRTRITSVLATVQKRLKGQSCEQWLATALDQIAVDPSKTIMDFMPK